MSVNARALLAMSMASRVAPRLRASVASTTSGTTVTDVASARSTAKEWLVDHERTSIPAIVRDRRHRGCRPH
jgi:hypothetical protein